MGDGKLKAALARLFGKGKHTWLLLLALGVGIVLLVLPYPKKEAAAAPEPETEPAEEWTEAYLAREEARLEEILSRVEGAGKVHVMLTLAGDGTRHLLQDQKLTDDSLEVKTVVLKNGSSEQTVSVRTDAPAFRGAIVVAQGASSAAVRLALTQAVSAVTGLGADKISVMKMQDLGGQE